MQSNCKNTPQEIKALLDSDDELPDTYNDCTELPAYQDDSRFNPIKFPWVENFCNKMNTQEESVKGIDDPPQQVDIPKSKNEKTVEYKKVLISEGYLTKRDLYIVQSIEHCMTEKLMLWFIEFLKTKYLSKSFDYRGCLVEDLKVTTECVTSNHYVNYV